MCLTVFGHTVHSVAPCLEWFQMEQPATGEDDGTACFNLEHLCQWDFGVMNTQSSSSLAKAERWKEREHLWICWRVKLTPYWAEQPRNTEITWGICSGSKLIFLLSNRWLVWRLCSCSKWFKVSQIPLLPVKSVVWRQARAFIYLFSIKEEEQQNHAVVTADGKERTGARGAIKIEGSPDVDCKLKYCLSSLLIAPNVILFLWNSFSESVCMRNICSLKSRPTIWINYQYLAAAHY